MGERAMLKLALTLLLLLVLGGSVPARVLADVDPASDVLLLDNVFVPYQPRVCSKLQDQLKELAADAKRADYPVKIALIHSSSDLGGAPELFGDPDGYARFLYGEISELIDGVVVIAMPGGFGMAPDRPEASVLADRSIPDDVDSDGLARAALQVVPKLASAAGKTLKEPKIASGCSSKGGSSNVLVFAAPIALLLIAGSVIALASRRPRGGEAE
jgi:hypothetical protein